MSDKYELARIFEEIAILLEIKGENPFKVRAYQAASRILRHLDVDLADFVAQGGLESTGGIGKAIGQKIREYVASGKIAYYEELKGQVPPEIFELMKIPGLGPKKALTLYQKLGIHSLGELEYACHENRLAELPGFGSKTQEKILEGIEQAKRVQGLFLLSDLLPLADGIAAFLRNQPGISAAETAGDIRRRKETVKSIDIVIAAESGGNPSAIIAGMPGVQSINEQKPNKITAELSGGMVINAWTVKPEEFAFALHYHTGNKKYYAKMQSIARKKGFRLRQYSLQTLDGQVIPASGEQDIYQKAGLGFVAPELREGLDELQFAASLSMPVLVEEQDIQGIFHVHTTYSDGSATLEEMAAAVRQKGWRYLGITDHSQSAVYARGLKIESVLAQRRAIDRFNNSNPDFTVFAGIETDILPDGSLDYPEDILAQFDFVIASIHSAFRQSRSDMTRRMVTAVKSPYVSMLGHPTGRILLARESYAVDMKEVILAAAGTGTVIEINASPYRLDLDWRLCREAKKAGVMFAINPDAHATKDLDYLRYGVAIARKGWLTANDIVNTRTSEEALAVLRRKRS